MLSPSVRREIESTRARPYYIPPLQDDTLSVSNPRARATERATQLQRRRMPTHMHPYLGKGTRMIFSSMTGLRFMPQSRMPVSMALITCRAQESHGVGRGRKRGSAE